MKFQRDDDPGVERRASVLRQEGLRDAAFMLERVWRNAITTLFVLWGLIVVITDQHIVWDYFRCLALAEGVMLIVITFLINVSYRRSSLRATGEARGMPSHIRWVAFSYLMTCAALVGVILDKWGETPEWFGLPMALSAFTAGVVALGFMFRFAIAKAGVGEAVTQRRREEDG